MTTTQPIGGNQFFSVVHNRVDQLPTLNVMEVTAARSHVSETFTTNKITLHGQFITTGDPPASAVVGGSGGLTGCTFSPGSTDVSGRLIITGTSAETIVPGGGDELPPSTVKVTYAVEYPTDQTVIVTATNRAAAMAVGTSRSIFVTSTSTDFTLHFGGVSGPNPEFTYFVILAI